MGLIGRWIILSSVVFGEMTVLTWMIPGLTVWVLLENPKVAAHRKVGRSVQLDPA
jgi:hypothetical protein